VPIRTLRTLANPKGSLMPRTHIDSANLRHWVWIR